MPLAGNANEFLNEFFPMAQEDSNLTDNSDDPSRFCGGFGKVFWPLSVALLPFTPDYEGFEYLPENGERPFISPRKFHAELV